MNEKPFIFSHLSQPVPYGRALLEALSPAVHFRNVPKETRLELLQNNEPVCHLVRFGTFEVHRRIDNLIMVTLSGPSAIDLSSVHDIYLLTTSSCKIATISLKEVHHLVEQQGGWKIYAQHMMDVVNKLYLYSHQLSAPTSYEMICYQLQELMNEPEAIRLNIPIER